MDEDNTTWPKNFMNIGNRTFLWTWDNKKEFVEFTLLEMTKPTKMFLQWFNYCTFKTKQEHDWPSKGHCDEESCGLRKNEVE